MKRALMTFAASLLIGTAAHAAMINVSTGLDATDTAYTTGAQPDAHWIVNGNPAQTVFPNNADWYGGWLANDSNSTWIAIDANTTDNGPAPYTFTRTFDLTGYSLPSVSITGGWAIDDEGTLALNGNTVATLGAGAWGGLTPFTINSGFVQGVNTLTITMTSDDRYLEGVRLQGTLTGDVAGGVPEPATWAMMIAGFALVGGMLRARTGKSAFA